MSAENLQQRLLRDGFHDDGFEESDVEVRGIFRVGCDRVDPDVLPVRIFANGPGELHAVHFRHPEVEQGDVRSGGLHEVKCFCAGGRGHGIEPDLAEHGAENFHVQGHVVDDEDLLREVETAGGCFASVELGVPADLEVGEQDGEDAALVDDAFDGEGPLHAVDEAFRDGKAEPGAVFRADAAVGGPVLNERLEDLRKHTQ